MAAVIRRAAASVLLGREAESLFIRPEKGGIIPKAAALTNLARRLPVPDPLPGVQQPLDEHILPDGRPRRLLEQAAQLRFAEIKPVRQGVEREIPCQIAVDIGHQGLPGVLPGNGAVFFPPAGQKHLP